MERGAAILSYYVSIQNPGNKLKCVQSHVPSRQDYYCRKAHKGTVQAQSRLQMPTSAPGRKTELCQDCAQIHSQQEENRIYTYNYTLSFFAKDMV